MKRKKYDYDLIVIGSGSGGSVGAHYAASLGKKVLMFEGDTIGGECPNFACVPTKALLHAAKTYTSAKAGAPFGVSVKDVSFSYAKVREWKNLVVSRTGSAHGKASFEKSGVHVIKEKARFISSHEVEAGEKTYSAAKFLIAAGSKVFIPSIPGLEDAGYITFKQAVDFSKPPASLLIFGGGAVGCEFAHIFSSFGTNVTLVNRSDRILSKEDKEVSGLVQAIFENEGISVLTNTSIEKIEKKGKQKKIWLKHGDLVIEKAFDEILIATGKVPEMDFAPEKAGLAVDHHRLQLNRYLQTNVSHIYAAGDIAGPYLFTHTAYYQSYIAAHNAFSYHKMRPDYRAIPRAVFIAPEVASVGMSEEDALEKGIKIKKGIAAIAILGRANTSNELDGFIKVITDQKGIIIGASIVAPSAGEMIHELTLAIKLRVKASVLAEMIHAYPTFSEGIKIACSIVE